jgi:hypothetical protein
MRVCDSRAENSTRKESVCQVNVLGAPPCVRMKTEIIVSQEQPRNIHLLTGLYRLNLVKSAFTYSRRIIRSTPYVQNTSVRLTVTDFL